ncbi:hypothetical protein CDG76_29860 [Nostoc sp. 'Peltigera membranacea cyanobiont' 210A]|uniref:hypothetical protein n=1 Tax=Nostoc sp. 'Peltigera membranacea cyanobiont' 210A TaxID=2014529 RepID=UPI000B95530C|nr:hypothetical protein [Nostoc sp. 'Peltigera membranacea cyanobiont' 210A]OYD90923.1 hypothetical protein CDG76_29860 [Nostoc sp. 'Peltigera membranacea cyanobiont' 210A]
MKKPFLQITRLFVAIAAGISFASLLTAQPSSAQVSSPADAFPSNSTTDQNTDPFARSNSDNFNMFDLIHRANFGNLNWDSNQQNEELNSAAAAFKARQQKLIQGQQQQPTLSLPTVTQPSVTPPLVTPQSGN